MAAMSGNGTGVTTTSDSVKSPSSSLKHIDFPNTLAAPLELNWGNVEKSFRRRYEAVFMHGNHKAHLDFYPKIIDGIKAGWDLLMILDTILCITTNFSLTDHRSRRRKFDHHGDFIDCIKEEVINCLHGVRGTSMLAVRTSTCLRIELRDVGAVWKDMSEFRKHHTGMRSRASIMEIFSAYESKYPSLTTDNGLVDLMLQATTDAVNKYLWCTEEGRLSIMEEVSHSGESSMHTDTTSAQGSAKSINWGINDGSNKNTSVHSVGSEKDLSVRSIDSISLFDSDKMIASSDKLSGKSHSSTGGSHSGSDKSIEISDKSAMSVQSNASRDTIDSIISTIGRYTSESQDGHWPAPMLNMQGLQYGLDTIVEGKSEKDSRPPSLRHAEVEEKRDTSTRIHSTDLSGVIHGNNERANDDMESTKETGGYVKGHEELPDDGTLTQEELGMDSMSGRGMVETLATKVPSLKRPEETETTHHIFPHFVSSHDSNESGQTLSSSARRHSIKEFIAHFSPHLKHKHT